jgi:hypothetical protein
MNLDALGFTWRENPTRVHLSSAFDKELGIEDAEDKSAKKATTTVWPSTQERPGDPDVVDTLVLQEGSGERSSQEDDSEKPRSREQQPTGMSR